MKFIHIRSSIVGLSERQADAIRMGFEKKYPQFKGRVLVTDDYIVSIESIDIPIESAPIVERAEWKNSA